MDIHVQSSRGTPAGLGRRGTPPAVLETLEDLARQLDPRRGRILRGAIAALRRMSPEGGGGAEEEFGPVLREEAEDELTRWSQLLRERREQAGLTRAELAARAGLSETTIKNLETGRQPPTRASLMRLLAVAELRLGSENLPGVGRDSEGFAPNCWLAPGFDPIKMIIDLAMQLNGRGGHIEQTHLYLDHMSAACWCALADQEGYAAPDAAMPLDRVARVIRDCIGGAGLDVIGLGPGDGKDEVALVRHLLCQGEPGDLRLYLLDISQPLLSIAYKHAADTLADRRGVAVFGIQGNFHHLPRYTQLLYMPERAHRRRMVCMFGYTFGNLQNEILFVRNSLVGFAPGDLLLLNVGLVCAPADRPDEVRRKDPRLSGRLTPNLQRRFEEWLVGPVRRYTRGVTDVQLSTELDVASCPVPGSYAAEVRATVRCGDDEERVFSMVYIKRYEMDALIECLRTEGWDPVECWRYGEEETRLLCLLRRR
ncbi:MAG: L-histidine N(alpha)-methyltransferase [Myxococcales bacterium]|nr:L-histidine N(alpha)-methyltransferase [Myxococcota bacterium]MDW8281266.1 L-histidine N(alpha)-methyltransferase [Myxococcales bacterium]